MPKSSVGSPTCTPSFANVSPASWYACALCTHAFVGMQPDAQARAAQRGLLLDAGDLAAELCGADRRGVPGGAASEDGDVDVHSESVPSFACMGSMAASIVSESASSATWEKPWRS